MDLRKQEQWNSTSSINAYYTKTLQNVQQKRDELVDYMQRAKLSREEYEELRMQIAELDHQLYETELNKLKDTQAFYQSQYFKGKVRACETNDDYESEDLDFVKLIPYNKNFVKIIFGSLDFNAYAYIRYGAEETGEN